MAETIFGKILAGQIPCHKVYEDDRVLAFLDINPLTRGHTLVIPKEPAATLDELSDESAAALGEERSRIVAALGHLEEQRLIELRSSDVRQRFRVLARPRSRDELLASLVDRFERREQAEVERIARVVSLVTHEGCQVNALTGYFGETRAEPCGHCTFCLTGSAQRLPEAEAQPPLSATVDAGALAALADANPAALGAARQRARFLCGITSPMTSRAKLTRDELFGIVADRRFDDVLEWCSS